MALSSKSNCQLDRHTPPDFRWLVPLCAGAVFAAALFSPAAVSQQASNSTQPSPATQPSTATLNKIAPGGFVALNLGAANITATKFQLPSSATTYPIAGLTIFPYYQASPQLKQFLNSTGGQALTQMGATPVIPPTLLPPTDTMPRINVHLPAAQPDERSAVKMAIVDKRRKDEIPWMVAHDGGQAFGLPADNDALAVMAPGTMFSAVPPRTMVLRCGTMWILTGARPAAVLTKTGAVAIKPFSIVAVEETWSHRLRAANLYGPPVELQLICQGKSSKVTVVKGQERTVSETTVAQGPAFSGSDLAQARKFSETRVASAGVSDYADSGKTASATAAGAQGKTATVTGAAATNAGTTAAAGASPADDGTTAANQSGASAQSSTPLPGLSMVSGTIAPESSSFIEGMKGLTPPFSNYRMSVDFQKMLADYGVTPEMRHDEINKEKLQRRNLATRPAINQLARNAQYADVMGTSTEPLSKNAPVPFPHVTEDLKTRRIGRQCLVKYLSSAVLEQGQNGHTRFKSGEAVFVADNTMIIDADDYCIYLRPGTTAHMVSRNGVVAVKNVKETEPGSVKIRIKGHIFDCAVGSELMVSHDAPDLLSEMRNDGVGRRQMHSIETAAGSVVVDRSEIDLTSLMQYSPIMRKLYKSKDGSDIFLVQEIMKQIVALNMVTGSAGGYQRLAGISGTH